MPKYLGIDGVRQLWSNVESKISSEIANADVGANIDLSDYVSYQDLSNYISVSSSDDLTWDHLSEGGLFGGNLSTFGAAIINAGWGWANYHDAYLPSDTTIVSSADIINIIDSDLNSGSEGILYTPIIGLGASILNNISFADDDITTFTEHFLSGIDIGSELPDDVLRTSNIVTNSENYNAQPDNIDLIYETIGESPSTTNYYIRSYWQGGNDSSALLITSYNLQENISNYAETMLNNVSWYYVNDTFVNGMMVYGGGISWIESIYTSLTESASSNQKSDLLVAFSPDSWNIENGAYDRVFNFIDDTGTATSMSVSDVSNESNGTTLVIQNYSINDNDYIPYGITKAYIPEFGWTFDNNGNDLLYIVHPTLEEIDGDLVNPSYGVITEKNISTYLSEMGITAGGGGNGNNPEIYYSATNEWYLSDESRGEDRILTQDTIGISGNPTDGIYFNNHTGGTDPIGVQHWNTDFIRIDEDDIEFPSDNNESYTFFDLKANPEWSGNSQISGINFRIRARHDQVNLETYDISNNQVNYAYLPTQEEIYNILLSYNLITASQLPDAFRYLSNN